MYDDYLLYLFKITIAALCQWYRLLVPFMNLGFLEKSRKITQLKCGEYAHNFPRHFCQVYVIPVFNKSIWKNVVKSFERGYYNCKAKRGVVPVLV